MKKANHQTIEQTTSSEKRASVIMYICKDRAIKYMDHDNFLQCNHVLVPVISWRTTYVELKVRSCLSFRMSGCFIDTTREQGQI